jgi:ABC-type multidrug transport system ATPase subunit
MAGADSVLSISGLNKRYGKTSVLNQLNLEVSRGAIHGLVGLNGSGKTTTMECVLGIQDYNGGDIQVLGRHPSKLWQGRGDVVGIFDTPGVHPGLTVRQVLEHASILCEKPARTPATVEKMLGISRYSNYKIRQLSLGNKRRTSIAHALIGQPAFVILDEPFNGLDAGGVQEVLGLIQRLNREEGTSFLLSSHQLAYLESICSHMAILHNGKIALSERIDNLYGSQSGVQRSRLMIRCDNPQAALELLRTQPGIRDLAAVESGVNLTLDGAHSSAINKTLVGVGIAVSELRLEKPSLSQVFQDIVNAPDTHPETSPGITAEAQH